MLKISLPLIEEVKTAVGLSHRKYRLNQNYLTPPVS